MLSLLFLCTAVNGQGIGTNTPEVHPKMSMQNCGFNENGESVCETADGEVVIDSNWRWTHATSSLTNCYTGNKWDQTLCPDAATCTKNCAIDGADENKYRGTYGVTTQGDSLRLNFVTTDQYGTNVGSRLYYMESSSQYKMWKLLGQEFSFDVDNSQLGCGLNGALYFVDMDQDGGMGKYPANKAGAKYGTGYCDAQCPHDMKWITGEANCDDWKPSDNDPNSGTGKYGTCCQEMDIWEANKMTSAYTPHVCSVNEATRCSGTDCGDNGADRYKGFCDKDGCDLNSYRAGNKTFYGPGMMIDTNSKYTVVTQFLTTTGDANGDLTEIKRFFVQNGKKYEEPMTNLPGLKAFSSLTDDTCAAQKEVMGDQNDFKKHGGMAQMGKSLAKGMVLAMSLWDDHYAHMLWLDSAYPLDQPVTKPGVLRGPCATSTGVPSDVESKQRDAHVVYSNLKLGAIGSTF